jgi:hypothetical protein
VICWMPHQLDHDWGRWVSVQQVLRATRSLVPALRMPPISKFRWPQTLM